MTETMTDANTDTKTMEILVPDIGDFAEVEIIEVLVSAGQQVTAEEPLITLESDKATMEIPAPQDGTITRMLVEVGQRVSEGTPIAVFAAGEAAVAEAAAAPAAAAPPPDSPPAAPSPPTPPPADAEAPPAAAAETHRPPPAAPLSQDAPQIPHASPAVRRFARELGARLGQMRGSGAKGRITKSDVKAWVTEQLGAQGSAAAAIPPLPQIDFTAFGEVTLAPLSRIKKLSGPHLQRAWLNAPHVTHHDEADVTDLEDFRQSLKPEAAQRGVRLTMLAFVIRVLARAMREFPHFNASLHADGEQLVLKQYCNIGIAVDTPQGLVVPVIRDVPAKTLFDLAAEMGEISARARDGKLKAADLQGGCMTISSLGGIGGRAFTPIINAPEVAILGITRMHMAPRWDGREFQPRRMLPLDLSYDHRVIDGAEAARFTAYLVAALEDMRRVLL